MKNNLDKVFKEKLEHGTAPYPEDLWDKIEAQLPAEKKSPPSLFGNLGRIGAFLALIVLPFAYYLLTDNKNTEHSISNSPERTKIELELKENNSDLEEIYSENATNEKPLRTSRNNTEENINLTSNTNQTNSIQNTTSNFANTRTAATGHNSIISIHQNSTSNAITGRFQRLNSTGKNFETQSSSTSQTFADPSLSDVTSMHSDGTSDKTIARSYPSNNSLLTNSNTKANRNSLFVQQLSRRKLEPVHYLKSNRRRYNAKKLLTECPAFIITGGKGIILDFYFSPDFAMREFNPRGIEFNSYSVARENSENPYLSFSAGMRFSYINKSGLALRTGINFTQINENFKYLNTNITGIDTIIVIDSGTNVRDTTYIETGETVDISTHNRYRSLDVPMLVGLEMPFNRKVKLSLNAGVFVNLLFQQRGRYIDQQGFPNWFVDQDVYKTSLALSYYGSLGVNYYINPRMDFMLEPNLRYYSQSFTVNDYPLTQEYLKFGVLSGIRYHF